MVGRDTVGKDTLVDPLRTEKYTGLAIDYGWGIVHESATFTGTVNTRCWTLR
ncbi:hypothetical protein [Streptomyces sp. NPDC058486]|uniref:hypothetical protein n=1 Tax=unclassified Streptomyces TaxID=2593676 RepID=UPI00365D0B7F